MRCCNCYHTFSSDDVVYQNESHGETVACCPSCGVSDMESTSACRICCDDFTEDEIMFGFCLDCLWEAIDYDISLKYMMQGKTLVDFLLNDWYESRVDIDYCSDQLFAFSVEQFKRLVADEKLMCAVSRNQDYIPPFLEACRLYCMPKYYKRSFGLQGGDFAEWYADYIKKEVTNG